MSTTPADQTNDQATRMRISTAVRMGGDHLGNAEQVVSQVLEELGGARPDIAMLFFTGDFIDELDPIVEKVNERLHPRSLAGVSAESVICGGREYEGQSAITLWAASMPGARVTSFHLSNQDLERLDRPEELREHIEVPADQDPYFLLLADPFSVPVLSLLGRLGEAYPGRPAFGGLASAGENEGENALVFDGQVLRHGLVGVGLWGNVQLDAVVSQGCRPIGRHMVVTKAQRNVIFELGGKPTLKAFDEILHECSEEDRELMKHKGLFVGCVINEYQPSFSRGDFLIRNIVGVDPSTRALALSDVVRVGQTVQFHVRDSESADEDLRGLLAQSPHKDVAGALLFSCNGRGTRLFPAKHHDARAVYESCGAAPVAGFFCAGEIGPVARRNFLHGHTASIALVRPKA